MGLTARSAIACALALIFSACGLRPWATSILTALAAVLASGKGVVIASPSGIRTLAWRRPSSRVPWGL